jgi:tetratricopeptide (TPR) repeat protein
VAAPAPKGSEARFARILLTLSLPSFAAGKHDIATRLLERALTLPEEGDPIVPGYRSITRAARTYWVDGNPALALGLAREAAAQFDRVHEVPTANWARLFVAQYSIAIGDHDTAFGVVDALLAGAQADYGTVLSWLHRLRALAFADLGRLDEALAAASECVLQSDALNGNHQFQAPAHAALAHVLRARGDAAGAERAARTGTALVPEMPSALAQPLAELALALLQQGRAAEARAVAGQIESLPLVDGLCWDRHSVTRLAVIEAKLATGETEAALEAARAERQRLDAMSAHLPDEAARERFWTRVPEHRRLLELAR